MIDLHVHTTASDGILSPKEVIIKAKQVGLSAVGIADHDTVRGIAEALLAGKENAIEVVPAMELSCYWLEKNRKEFHILGYFIDYQDKRLLEKLAFFQKEREARAQKSLAVLAGLGFNSEWNYLLQIAGGSIGRPHLARTILENQKNAQKLTQEFGAIPPMGAFIEKYMIPGKPAYVEKAGFEPKEAIDLIHLLGGAAVLAHPCFDITEGDDETMKALKAWGIDGLEAVAPFKTPEETRPKIQYFTQMANKYNLLVTGGSDYHGMDGVGAGLGFIEWGIKVEDILLDDLKKFILKSRAKARE